MEHNIEEHIKLVKHQIRKLERLMGTLIITDGETIITVQRADREKQRWQLRN
jgi:hypothetical protein